MSIELHQLIGLCRFGWAHPIHGIDAHLMAARVFVKPAPTRKNPGEGSWGEAATVKQGDKPTNVGLRKIEQRARSGESLVVGFKQLA